MTYGDDHDELANSEQPQAQSPQAVETAHSGAVSEVRLASSAARLPKAASALEPELPIVLKLWAHDVPNTGMDTRGCPDEAADIIKELYDALIDVRRSALAYGSPHCAPSIRKADSALAKARGEQ